MFKRFPFQRLLGLGLSAIIFCNQVLFANAPEMSIWEQRRQSARQAPKYQHQTLPTPSIVKNLNIANSKHGVDSSTLSSIASLLSINGSIREIKLAKTPEPGKLSATLIYIQDVHGQLEAQKNIAAMILKILDLKPNAVIGLEGSSGEIPINQFRRSSTLINKEIGSFFLNAGLITGAEYAGFASEKTPQMIGVENKELYLRNVAAIKQAMPRQKDELAKIENEKRQVQLKKPAAYSADMMILDQKWRGYQEGKINMGDYLSALTIDNSVSLVNFPNINLFLETWAIEKNLNFEKADRERNQFLSHLAEKLTKSELDKFLSQSIALKSGAITYPDYYKLLKETASTAGLSLSKTSEFSRYIAYVLQADAIQPETLLTEVSQYEKSLWNNLCETDEQRQLYQTTLKLDLTEKLIRLTMTSQEWKQYVQLRSTGHAYAIFESFYKATEARNLPLASNLTTKLSASNDSIGILVAGGFHSDGLNQILSKGNFTLITVTPKLTKIDPSIDNEYLSVFTREKTSLEKLFDAPKISIVQTLATNPVDKNATADVVSRLSEELPDVVAKALATGSAVEKFENHVLAVAKSNASLPMQNGKPVHLQQTDTGTQIAVYGNNHPWAKAGSVVQQSKRILSAANREWWFVLPILVPAALVVAVQYFVGTPYAGQLMGATIGGSLGLLMAMPIYKWWHRETHSQAGWEQIRFPLLIVGALTLTVSIGTFATLGLIPSLLSGLVVFDQLHRLRNWRAVLNPEIAPFSGGSYSNEPSPALGSEVTRLMNEFLTDEMVLKKASKNRTIKALLAQMISHLRNVSFRLRHKIGFDDYPYDDALKGPFPFRPSVEVLRKAQEFTHILASDSKSQQPVVAESADPSAKAALIKEQRDFIKKLTKNPLGEYEALRDRLKEKGPQAAFPEFRANVQYLLLELKSSADVAELCKKNPYLTTFRTLVLNRLEKLPSELPYLETFYAIERAVEFFDAVARTKLGKDAAPLYHSARYEYYLHSLLGELPEHILIPTIAPLGSMEFLKMRGVPIGFVGVETEAIRVDGFWQTPYELFIHDINHARRMFQLLKEAAQKKGLTLIAFIKQSTEFVKNTILPLIIVSKQDDQRTRGRKQVLKMILFDYLHEQSFAADPDVLRVELIRPPQQRSPFEFIRDDTNVIYYTDIRPTGICYSFRKLAHDYYDEPGEREALIALPEARTREMIVEATQELLKALDMDDIPDETLMEFVSADDFPEKGMFRAGLQADIERRPGETIPLGFGVHPSLAPLLETKAAFQTKILETVSKGPSAISFLERDSAMPQPDDGHRVGIFVAPTHPLTLKDLEAINAAAENPDLDEVVIVLSRQTQPQFTDSIEQSAILGLMTKAAIQGNSKISIAIAGSDRPKSILSGLQATYPKSDIHILTPKLLSETPVPSAELFRILLADGELQVLQRWLPSEAISLIERWALYRGIISVNERRQAYRHEAALIDELLSLGELKREHKWQEAKKDFEVELSRNPLLAMRAVYSYYFPEVRQVISDLAREFPHEVFMRSMRIGQGLDSYHEPIIDQLIEYQKDAVPALKDFPHRYTSSGSEETIREYMTTLQTRGVKRIYVVAGEYEGYQAIAKTRGIETINVSFDADPNAYDPGYWFISNPSARNGNILPDGYVERICDAGHTVFYDLSYLSLTDFHRFDVSHPNIEVVAISFSKPYGVFYFRQGFSFSRTPIEGMEGNIWFKNVFSLMIAEAIMKKIGPQQLVRKYRALQHRIIAKLNQEFGLGLKASDVLLLAHRIGEDGLSDEQKKLLERYKRGDGDRLTLTPYLLEAEGLPPQVSPESAEFQGAISTEGPLLEGARESTLIDPSTIDVTKDKVDVSWAKSHFYYAKKVQPVFAHRARAGEVIETRVKGYLVTSNVAKEGDWKITTFSGDQYCISDEMLRQRYHTTPNPDGTYRPRERVVKVLEVTEPVRFLAPWGSWQFVPAGSVIVFLSPTEIYAIHRDNYRAAYVRVNKQEAKVIQKAEEPAATPDESSFPEEYQRMSAPEVLSWVIAHIDSLPSNGPPILQNMIELVHAVQEELPSVDRALTQDVGESKPITVSDALRNFTSPELFMGTSYLKEFYFRKKRIGQSVVEANRQVLNKIFTSGQPGARQALIDLFQFHFNAHSWNPVIHATISEAEDWRIEKIEDFTIMFSAVFKVTYVARGNADKRVEVFIKRDNDDGALINDVVYTQLQNQFLSGPPRPVPVYLKEKGNQKGLLVSFTYPGQSLRQGFDEIRDKNDPILLLDFVRRLAEHAALGDIFGRNDRKMSNTRIEIKKYRVGMMMDFDNRFLLDGPQNYDWILQDIREGVSEQNLLVYLQRTDDNPDIATTFEKAYRETWARVAVQEPAINDFINRSYSPEKAAVATNTLLYRLAKGVDLVWKENQDALAEYKIRLLYKQVLREIVHEAPDHPSLDPADLRRHLSKNKFDDDKYAFQQVLNNHVIAQYPELLKGRPNWTVMATKIEQIGATVLGSQRIEKLKQDVLGISDSGGYWIENDFYKRHLAAGVELSRNILLIVFIFVLRSHWFHSLPLGWALSISIPSTLLVMASIPLIFKYGHVPGRGWEVTNKNPDIQYLTRLFAWSTLPLAMLPFAPNVALISYVLLLMPLTVRHHRIDNPITSSMLTDKRRFSLNGKVFADLAPMQQGLLEKGFDFEGSKAILSRPKPFYAVRSAENLGPKDVIGFHLGALFDSTLIGTEFETQTREHLLRRVETSNLKKEKRPDILVVRYQPSANPVDDKANQEQAREELRQTLLDIAGNRLSGKMAAYLKRAVIVTEPIDQLIRPSDVLRRAQMAGFNSSTSDIRFHLYTATPDQIDMNDTVVRVIVYSLLSGMRVLPISNRLEADKAASINA